MFNNPYMPYSYNPMPTAMNPYGYPTPQPTPQQTVPAVTATNKIYVNGIEDVKNRQLPNNSDYIFLDNDKPLVYRKILDATGKMDVQVFKIEPYEEKPVPSPASADMSQYVLKSDFEELKKEIEKLRRDRYDGSGKNRQSQNS